MLGSSHAQYYAESSSVLLSPKPPSAPLPYPETPIFNKNQVPSEHDGAIGEEWHGPGPGGLPDIMVSNVTEPTLTSFLISGATAAVIVAPGGGYTGRDERNL